MTRLYNGAKRMQRIRGMYLLYANHGIISPISNSNFSDIFSQSEHLFQDMIRKITYLQAHAKVKRYISK